MTGPSRERAIERLLAVPEGRPSEGAIGPCADAEVVAAWLDGGLTGADAVQFEAHVAACASCQELLATVVRMTPVEAPALRSVPRRPWTAWALPLAAAAVLVLVVWTTWRGSSRSAAPSELKEQSRMARADTPSPVAVPEPAAPPASTAQATPRSGTASPPAVANRAASRPAAVAPTPPPASPAERSEREAAAPGAPQARQSAKAEESIVDSSAVQAPSAPPSPPIAETVAPRADTPAPAAPREASPAQAKAGEARARRAGDVAALAGASQVLRDAAAARVTVQAPGAMWRWRANRVLDYSSDGGATWRPSAGATAAQAADILAGASPMAPAAWMVGRRGLVLVTLDGVRFEVRTPPATVDLVGVQASDRQIAVVRGAAGEAWRTTDGGRTWIAIAPGP